MVKDYDTETGFATLEQRNKFVKGDEVEFMLQNGGVFKQTIDEIYTLDGESVNEAPHPQQLLKVKTSHPVKPFDMMRKEDNM